MKPYLIIMALSATAVILLFRTCEKQETTIPIVDSLENANLELQRQMDSLLSAVPDTIEVIRTEVFTKVVTRFETIYGKPDTVNQPIYIADSSQLVKCNECNERLDSNRIALELTQDMLENCEWSNEELKKKPKKKIGKIVRDVLIGVIVGICIK